MKIQSDLDNMQEWSRTWLLNLNLERCKVMHISRIQNYYKIEGSSIELSKVNFEKDLEIWLTSSLKPSLHSC